jgi:hypothetical protein
MDIIFTSSYYHSEFTFLYNQLGPPASNSPAQYKHLAKQIGQGLALVEFVPQNVQHPASAFPCTSSPILSGTQTQTQIPDKSNTAAQAVPSLILLSGSQVALEEDLEALKEHLNTAEKFSLIPITPSQATPAVPAIPGVMGVQGVSTSGTVSPPRTKALQIPQGTAELSDHVGKARKVPYKSVSELLMKLYPTVPMQTQVLADYCTACLEEALTVYCVERLTSACGNGMISSHTVSASSTVSTVSPPILDMDSPRIQPKENLKLKTSISSPIRGALRGNTGLGLLEREKGSIVPLKLKTRSASEASMSQGSGDAVGDRCSGDRDRERRKDSSAGSSSFTPVQDPLCVPFLHLLHSALRAAPASPFFLNRSSGILHMPFLLPKHLSLSLRTQVVERILEAFPNLQTYSGDLFCDPLFPGRNVPPVSTESGSKITDNHENIPMWCEASTPLNSAANSVNLTFFGAAHLFPSVASSCVVSGVGVQSVSPSSNSLLRRVEMTSRSVEDELNGTGAPTSLPVSASTSIVAQLVSTNSNNSINSIINNSNNSNSNNINTLSAQQADIRDRARANSNDSRGRDRSTSFTPPIAPTPLGDFRSLVDYDSLIAGTLPLWLRRRAYSLEVAVNADGIFLFFFNLSSAVLNTVCEISASVAAMGVRTYNEQIRQQLIVLGVLKNKILPPIKSLEILELELNKSEEAMTSSTVSSPLKGGGVTLFTGLAGSNGGSGVGVRSAMQATTGV